MAAIGRSLAALATLALILAGCTGDNGDARPDRGATTPVTAETATAPAGARPLPTVAPEPTATATPTRTPTSTPAVTSTPTRTPTPAPTPTATPTPTPAPTPTALRAPEPTDAALAACAGGVAVHDPANNPGLVRDCAALLDALDTLLGDHGSADWSADRPIAEWSGVLVDGSPPRVAHLSSHTAGPVAAGVLPPVLGQLSALRYLGLYNQQLTGEIPGGAGLAGQPRPD